MEEEKREKREREKYAYDEGIVERGEDVSNAKDLLALSDDGLDGEHLLLHDFSFLGLWQKVRENQLNARLMRITNVFL